MIVSLTKYSVASRNVLFYAPPLGTLNRCQKFLFYFVVPIIPSTNSNSSYFKAQPFSIGPCTPLTPLNIFFLSLFNQTSCFCISNLFLSKKNSKRGFLHSYSVPCLRGKHALTLISFSVPHPTLFNC